MKQPRFGIGQSSDATALSYAGAAQTRSGRGMIRLMENATGRMRLIGRAQGFQAEITENANFFDVMADRYGLSLEVASGALDNIPRDGPVIVLANHPFGILDGLMLGQILGHRRMDFRLLANSVFDHTPALTRHLLPISFETGRAARAKNLGTRRTAFEHLQKGQAIGVFPGGTVSTGATPFARALDPVWRRFTARLIAKSRATVVPLYFDGQASRLFQIASHLHQNLRLGLLIREFHKRVDTPVSVAIGRPLCRDVLDPFRGDAKAMMDFLRKATYELSSNPVRAGELGYEFEERRRVIFADPARKEG